VYREDSTLTQRDGKGDRQGISECHSAEKKKEERRKKKGSKETAIPENDRLLLSKQDK